MIHVLDDVGLLSSGRREAEPPTEGTVAEPDKVGIILSHLMKEFRHSYLKDSGKHLKEAIPVTYTCVSGVTDGKRIDSI